MDRFGEYLRTAREARNVSLGEISDSTHISVRFLEALENEQFDILPGGVFVISFTRQYARIVGLDENEAVQRLNQVAHPVESALGEWTPRDKNADDTGAKLAELITDFMRRRGMTLVGGVMTLVLVAGGLSYFQITESFPTAERAASTEPARSGQTVVSDGAAPPASPPREARPVEVLSREEPNDGASEIAKGHSSIQLELKLTDRAWVRVVADGERVLEDNLEAGFEQTIRADDSVQLFIGNAGGVKVALNGESMPPIGPTGHVRRVDVSPTGMEVVDIEPKPGAEPTLPSPRPSEI
jgi:cytoskeletal protein RodZ